MNPFLAILAVGAFLLATKTGKGEGSQKTTWSGTSWPAPIIYSGDTSYPNGRPSEHFSWKELTQSTTAAEYGLDNSPDSEAQKNLITLCAYFLEPLRLMVGAPIYPTSGFRSYEVQEIVNPGLKKSQHNLGQAVDFYINGWTADQILEFIRKYDPPFPLELIAEHHTGHVHAGIGADDEYLATDDGEHYYSV